VLFLDGSQLAESMWYMIDKIPGGGYDSISTGVERRYIKMK
jgi:hypothetical protein